MTARAPERRRAALLEGAAAGATFGLLPGAVRDRRWVGPVYGLGIWLVYQAVAPLLGLEHAKEPRPAERAVFALDHAVYGLIVAGAR